MKRGISMLIVKFVGFGGSGLDYPCYEDGNGKLYFDCNNGCGRLNLHTGAYRDSFGDICGEPDRRSEEIIQCSKPFKRHHRRKDYMMLERLRQDCDFFLGPGCGCENNLYYKTVEEHCNQMEKLWKSFGRYEKPNWLTLEQIKSYRVQMLKARNKPM